MVYPGAGGELYCTGCDDILKTEFGLPQGLADTSKTKIKLNTQTADKRSATGYKQVEQDVHRVQLLDPATGTGTFLSEVVKHIYNTRFKAMQGVWSSYVEEHLIPRLNGFELLMTSYAMAHLKLDMLLTDTGFTPTREQRLKIYLTNSLEEHHPDTGTLFASWLSDEANQANHLKRDAPVMVVLGNPPYSGESANKGEWIMNLMEDYKKEPGGGRLQEKNPKWLNDDYVKFMRFGQHFIEKNGEGILAFINPHGYLDNPTFRGMRWHLLNTYDTIYTIDLHGNSKKKETAPGGGKDENVFDIQQGVSINLFVKTGKKKKGELATVLHFDVYGKRESKYDFLVKNNLKTIPFTNLKLSAPQYFFVSKDYDEQKEYDKGFRLNELMTLNALGYQTHRDKFAVDVKLKTLVDRIKDFVDPSIADLELKKRYNINESKDWILQSQRIKLKNELDVEKFISLTSYRPFDNQFAILNTIICDRPRKEIIQHVLQRDNYCLLSSKQQAIEGFRHCFVTRLPANDCVMSTTSREANQVFPLYLYPQTNGQQSIENTHRTPNLNKEIVQKIAEGIGLTFNPEKENTANTFAPIDILDYIYAVLHSPSYREKYKEFLKIHFPTVPYPDNAATFQQLVQLGGELRQLHLLESPVVERYITGYPVNGLNTVGKVRFEAGKVYINESQYFEGVPDVAWHFYIGGYQPAQKWLKDRKDRVLSFEDILHYQKIIVALTETDRLMKEIDKIGLT